MVDAPAVEPSASHLFPDVDDEQLDDLVADSNTQRGRAPWQATPPPTLVLPDMAMIADVLLMVAAAAITSSLGKDAAWTPDERAEIHKALARILKRLPISAVERVGPFADVLALVAALAPWAMRVWMQRTFKAQAAAAMARAAATTPGPAAAEIPAAPPPSPLATSTAVPAEVTAVPQEVAALFGALE